MKTFLLFLLVVGAAIASFAGTCEVASNIPSEMSKVGAGSATAHYDGITSVKGGQAAYVKIKNENALGVSYELTVAQDSKPTNVICTYKALLTPKTSVILWGSLFAEPPVAWKITVGVGPESDAGVLTYEVYSKTK
jgi:hypothetical protein